MSLDNFSESRISPLTILQHETAQSQSFTRCNALQQTGVCSQEPIGASSSVRQTYDLMKEQDEMVRTSPMRERYVPSNYN